MKPLDINGLTLSVGDQVAFSDAGRMGSVHTGVINKVGCHSFPEGNFRLHIVDDRTKRVNIRYSMYTLCLNGLTEEAPTNV
jgi:hypothetical protein